MTQKVLLGARFVAGLVGGLIGFAIGPVTGSLLAEMLAGKTAGSESSEVGRWVGMAAGLLTGALLGAFLVGRTTAARWSLTTAFVVGGVAFLAGFAGPMLLTPESPQGPLLGIFLTGPLGFVAGAVLGLCVGLVKEHRPSGQSPA